jgi:hypothetical protein
MKYTAGHAEESGALNMMADMMNVMSNFGWRRVLQDVEHLDTMSDDARQLISNLVPSLSKLGSDWRFYQGDMIKAINERRRLSTGNP